MSKYPGFTYLGKVALIGVGVFVVGLVIFRLLNPYP